MNEQTKEGAAEAEIENILGAIHLLQRLLSSIIEAEPEVSHKFFWVQNEGEKTRAEVICETLIGLFFKEGFCVQKNAESNDSTQE